MPLQNRIALTGLVLAALLQAQVPQPAPPKRVMPGTVDPDKKTEPEAKKAAPQEPVNPADREQILFRDSVTYVLVPTTVTDNRGAVVNGLKPQDFELFDNGKPQQINRDVAFLPLSMVICIQRSANVEKMLPNIQKVGNLMRDMLVGQDGEAAIISFDHRIQLIQEFTNDAEKITAALLTLTPGGNNSRLNDATQQAIRMLRAKKDRRKVILLISETLDRSSEARPKEIATELQVHNIDVFTVNISRVVTALTARPDVPRPDPLPVGARPRPGIVPNDPTVYNQIGGRQGQGGDVVPVIVEMFRGVKGLFIDNPAELYTKFTGGREYTYVSQKDLERALTAIGEEIRSQYILSYSPNNRLEGGFHSIEVKVNRPNLKVKAKPGYWMAAVPDGR